MSVDYDRSTCEDGGSGGKVGGGWLTGWNLAIYRQGEGREGRTQVKERFVKSGPPGQLYCHEKALLSKVDKSL